MKHVWIRLQFDGWGIYQLVCFEQRQVWLRTTNAIALKSFTPSREDLDLLHGLQISGAQQSQTTTTICVCRIKLHKCYIHNNLGLLLVTFYYWRENYSFKHPKYIQMSLLIKVSISTNKILPTSIYYAKGQVSLHQYMFSWVPRELILICTEHEISVPLRGLTFCLLRPLSMRIQEKLEQEYSRLQLQ